MTSRKRGIIALSSIVLLALAVWLYLRPVTDSDDDAPSGDQNPVVRVKTAVLVRATLRGYVEGYATVIPEPEHGTTPGGAARVTSAIAGIVTKAYVASGDRVVVGSPLFALDDRAARAAVARDQQLNELAQSAVVRQRGLLASDNASVKSVQEAEAQAGAAAADLAGATVQLGWTQIRSPVAGIVTNVTIKAGDGVDTTTPVAEVVDPSRPALTAQISLSEASALRPGQRVEVGSDSQTTGLLEYVSPSIDPATGAVDLRASITSGSHFRLGENVKIRVQVAEHPNVWAVSPASTVTADDGSTGVFRIENGTAHRIPISVGLRDGDRVEIESRELKAGDVIVTVGAYGLPDGAKVQITP